MTVDTVGTIIIAAIAATPPTIMALAAFIKAKGASRKIEELHVLVNSRLSELLAATAAANKSEGELKGRKDLQAEQTETLAAKDTIISVQGV